MFGEPPIVVCCDLVRHPTETSPIKKMIIVLIELLQLHQKGDLFDPQKMLVISPKISQQKGHVEEPS